MTIDEEVEVKKPPFKPKEYYTACTKEQCDIDFSEVPEDLALKPVELESPFKDGSIMTPQERDLEVILEEKEYYGEVTQVVCNDEEEEANDDGTT